MGRRLRGTFQLRGFVRLQAIASTQTVRRKNSKDKSFRMGESGDPVARVKAELASAKQSPAQLPPSRTDKVPSRTLASSRDGKARRADDVRQEMAKEALRRQLMQQVKHVKKAQATLSTTASTVSANPLERTSSTTSFSGSSAPSSPGAHRGGQGAASTAATKGQEEIVASPPHASAVGSPGGPSSTRDERVSRNLNLFNERITREASFPNLLPRALGDEQERPQAAVRSRSGIIGAMSGFFGPRSARATKDNRRPEANLRTLNLLVPLPAPFVSHTDRSATHSASFSTDRLSATVDPPTSDRQGSAAGMKSSVSKADGRPRETTPGPRARSKSTSDTGRLTLIKLCELREQGLVTNEEFASLKAVIMDGLA